ncbi:hypothetical protein STCU_10555 [Strigomonas culicis]|uniref:Uncharacterized protein n=1 Tax=Strigomonas culicis TaxID=28005 RepID=S9USJ8_9TRYP|nr:hypothetical protein STCU_10555 [Strigomonas culicis]|eukprot:EPY17531.1 hypothetical protein STCU_10555 [Strigomonas culicis]
MQARLREELQNANNSNSGSASHVSNPKNDLFSRSATGAVYYSSDPQPEELVRGRRATCRTLSPPPPLLPLRRHPPPSRKAKALVKRMR